LFKESGVRLNAKVSVYSDTGYQGIKKIHANSFLPQKRKRGEVLSKEVKASNRELASFRILNEHVIGRLKIFKIISDRYRNRRRRFRLRFNLICGIHNFELKR
jgi:hypothetical protein